MKRHRVDGHDGLGVLDEVAELAVALVADGLVQRDRLTRVLLDLQHLLRRDVHFLGELFGRGLAAQVLEQLTLDAAELVDDLDHVHRDADGAGLVGHGAGDGLTDPPRGVGGELVALGVVELLDRADQAEVALLDQVQERHAAAGVALGQRDDEAQVGLEQVVLRAVAVAADPEVVAALRGGELLARLGELGHLLRAVQAGLDALGELDFFLGVEQRDLADLLQVRAHRVRGGGELGVLAGLPQRLGLLFVPDEIAGGLVLLGRLGDVVVTGGVVGAVLGGLGVDDRGALDGGVVDLDDLEVLEFDPSASRSSSGSASRSSPASTASVVVESSTSSPSAPFLARPRAALAAAFLAGAFVARLAGAVPLAAFAAAAFLAGALVAVRFTGSSIAGLTFVAATCTPSVLRDSVAWACATVKRRLSVDGVCYLLGYLPPSVMRPPFTIVTTEWGTAATSGKLAVRRAVCRADVAAPTRSRASQSADGATARQSTGHVGHSIATIGPSRYVFALVNGAPTAVTMREVGHVDRQI